MDLFTKVVPGEEERQWLLHTLAARFIGENKDHKIGFGKGPASNGKSILISLCRLIFGDYQRILPKEVLMGKGSKGGAASPDLAKLRGVRLVFAPEPAVTDVLNESLSKTLSGDDEITVRQLYCGPFQMKIFFMLWFMSNHFIRIPADGDGIWRRLQVMPFTTLFTDFVELRSRTYTEGLVYAKDPALKARLPFLRDAATTILVNIALETMGRVATSPRIEALTRDYRLTQDKVAYFIDSRIEKKDGNRLPVATLRGALKEWHRTGTETPLDINMVIDRLMRDPYGYAFNSARNLGFGMAIRDAFALDDSGVADEAPLDAEQEFITCFAKCHIATKDELDFVPLRDVATWAAHNSMRLQN